MAYSKESQFKAMKRLHRNYVRGCQRRNIYWDISIEDFHRLTSQTCIYCGKPPHQKSRTYTYNGLDRKDNKKGYTLDNVVTSCGECNFIKKGILSFEEMKVVGAALARYRRGEK